VQYICKAHHISQSAGAGNKLCDVPNIPGPFYEQIMTGMRPAETFKRENQSKMH